MTLASVLCTRTGKVETVPGSNRDDALQMKLQSNRDAATIMKLIDGIEQHRMRMGFADE